MSTNMKEDPLDVQGDDSALINEESGNAANPIVVAANNERKKFGQKGWLRQEMTDDRGVFQGGTKGRVFGRFRDKFEDQEGMFQGGRYGRFLGRFRDKQEDKRGPGLLGKARARNDQWIGEDHSVDKGLFNNEIVDDVQNEDHTREAGSLRHRAEHIDVSNPDAVADFQYEWNQMNPDDQIQVDGKFGPQTEARLRMSQQAQDPETGEAYSKEDMDNMWPEQQENVQEANNVNVASNQNMKRTNEIEAMISDKMKFGATRDHAIKQVMYDLRGRRRNIDDQTPAAKRYEKGGQEYQQAELWDYLEGMSASERENLAPGLGNISGYLQ